MWRLWAAGVHLSVPVFIRVRGPLDAAALDAAMGDVVHRYEILRTTISEQNGIPRQVIHTDFRAPALLPLALGGGSGGMDAGTAINRDVDLTADLPIRAYLGSFNSVDHRLLLVIHPIAFDAWSHRPLVHALFDAYTARSIGKAPEWRPLAAQYSEFASWQRRRCAGSSSAGSAAERQLPYWSNSHSGDFAGHPRTGTTVRMGTLPVRFNPALHDRLLALARSSRTSLGMILQAAVAALLTHLGCGENIGIAVVTSGRSVHWAIDLVGLFQGTLLLRFDTSADPCFADLLTRVRDEHVRVFQAEDFANPAWHRCSGRAMVTLRSAARHEFELASSRLCWSVGALPCATEEFDLGFDLIEHRGPDQSSGGIEGRLRHNLALFDRRSALSAVSGLLSILESVADSASQPVRLQKTPKEEGPARRHSLQYMPAGNPTQRRLVRIWERLLRIRRIGIRDDFLTLGGNAAIAARMVEEIAAIYREHLPLQSIMCGVTIEELEYELVRRIPPSRIAPLQEGNPGLLPRFFYFHGDWSGGGYYARELAQVLPAEQPFYVLHPHGMRGDDLPSSIESMAEDYLEDIRTVQPHGPYYLGGYCIGGLVALETARRLRSLGEHVPMLILVHSQYLGRQRTDPVVDESFQTCSPRERAQLLYMCYMARLLRYQPAPYPGPVTLLWPTEEWFIDVNPHSYWQAVCPSITLHDTPGSHGTCVTDYVRDLGAELRSALQGSARSELGSEMARR